MKKLLPVCLLITLCAPVFADDVEETFVNWTGVNLQVTDNAGAQYFLPPGVNRVYLPDGASFTATWLIGGTTHSDNFTVTEGEQRTYSQNQLEGVVPAKSMAKYFGAGFSSMAIAWVSGYLILGRIIGMLKNPQNPDL